MSAKGPLADICGMALWHLLHCDLGRIANTRRADLYDLSCDYLSKGIVSANKIQQSLSEGQLQIFDFIVS